MEVYTRIVNRIRGAMWAHHRRLMPERQAQRILGYVYSNKYEYQIRFDQMTCVGTELDGKVEVAATPAGHIKRVRIHPSVEDLSATEKENLLFSAYMKAAQQGMKLMEDAETRVYKQFLADIKPIVLGIRDNPEFFTVAEDSVELPGGTLASPSQPSPQRTIPYERAFGPSHEWRHRAELQRKWLAGDQGRRWAKSLQGKEYMRYFMPSSRPRGAPGPKKAVQPFELPVAYTPMDEARLLRRNWQSYLDNKHVAETLWTRARIADREKTLRLLQKSGQAWHSPLSTAEQRY